MNDDDLTPLHELASSHLDGDNSPEERAHVAATPELQSLVASFEDVRARLADVPPAPAAARDSALAAALAAFDDLQADGAGSAATLRPAAPVISLDSRRRWPQRVMGIAAAVAAVGVIGVGITRIGGADDKTSTSADTAAKAEFDVEAAADSAPEMNTPMATISSIGGGASVAIVVNSVEELAALPVPGDTMTVSGGEEPAVAPNDTQAASTETTMATAETVGPRERDNAYSVIVSALPAANCLTGEQVFLADVVFQGQLAVAARDMVTGVTYAIANDCTVLASVAP